MTGQTERRKDGRADGRGLEADKQMVIQMDGWTVQQRGLWTHDVMVRQIDG